MKQRIELTVTPRESGKSANRANRLQKHIPAVIYGAMKNMNVTLHENDIVKYNTRAYENALFNLKSTDAAANGKVVLMKTVDVHPLTRRPVHVDLFALDLTKTVRIHVEVRLEGKAIGLADGGLLNIVNRQIEIECLPTDIPDSFVADISHLGVGDALHVSDINVGKGIKVISAPDLTIAVVNLAEEEAATPVAAAAATDAAAPAAGAKAAAAPAAGAKAAAAPAADKKK